MIKIITGKINTAKTTKVIELYQKNHIGDGFVSLKFMIDDKVDHYEVMKLSTGEKKILMIHQESPDFLLPSKMTIGPYHLMLESLKWVDQEVEKMIINNISPIYLDEIGLLELEHKGFYPTLQKMITSNLDLIIVVRSYLLDHVIKEFSLNQVEILST